MSKVVVHRHAVKYLQRLPKATKQRIKDILEDLASNPLDKPALNACLENGPVTIAFDQGNYESYSGLMKKRMSFMWITSAREGMYTSRCRCPQTFEKM